MPCPRSGSHGSASAMTTCCSPNVTVGRSHGTFGTNGGRARVRILTDGLVLPRR
jgi:hypothetical protein